MARKYVGVSTVGDPKDVFERIRRIVQMQKQTRMIPAVKFERNPRGLFYVFLAVEGPTENLLPDAVATVLKFAGLTGKSHWPLKPSEVQPMTGGAELETHSLNVLKYKSLWPNDLGDPLNLSDASSSVGAIEDHALTERYNQLLNWLSANVEGTWQTFARVCDVLHLADDIKGARSIFRRLILLGCI